MRLLPSCWKITRRQRKSSQAADDLSSGRAIDGQNEAAAVVLEDYEETKKELADWVNASPEELADVIAGM
nr:MAG TPA: hypothetical protein [Caudoviricetes sp.]